MNKIVGDSISIKMKFFHDIGSYIKSSEGIMVLLIAILVIVTANIESRFMTANNFITVAKQTSYLLICAYGQMCVLITGGFDLSQGGVISLLSIITAIVMVNVGGTGSVYLAVGICVLLAIIIGLINGFVVAYVGVNPLIVTLAMGSILSGLALIISGGGPIFGLPPVFNKVLGSGTILGFPIPAYIAILIGIIMYILFNYTRHGNYVYAIGGNIQAAVVTGVPTRFYLLSTYMLSALLAGFAALLFTARVNCGEPLLGSDMALRALTAAVLGGISLKGGLGTVVGATLGAAFMMILGNSMDLLRVGSYTQMVVLGILLLGATAVDRLLRRD